jgi:hypothetical protein
MRPAIKSALIAAGIFALFFAFDIWWIHRSLPRELFGDEWRYVLYADNLLHGFYSPRGRVFLSNGPGYPLFLMPFAKAHWTDGARYANALLHGGAMVYAWAILSSRLRRAGAIAALVVLGLYAPLYEHIRLIYTETLCFFLVTAWIFHALKSRKSRRHSIIAGCLFGFLCLTKVVFGVVLVVCLVCLSAVWLLRRSGAVGIWLRQAALAFALCLPYLGYTYHLTGRVLYWGSLGPNTFYWLTSPYPEEWGDWYHQGWVARNPILNAHHKAIYDQATGLSKDPSLSEREQVFNLTTPEADAIFWQAAVRNVREHPAKFALNWCANLVRLFFDVPVSVRGTPFWNVSSISNLPLLIWTVFVLILAWLRRVGPPVEWQPIWGFFVLAIGAYSFASIVARYLIPLLPIWWIGLCSWAKVAWRRQPETKGA